METWNVTALNPHLSGSGMIVSEYLHHGQYVLYYGDGDLRVAFSKNLVAWHAANHPIASPRKASFDAGGIKVISATSIEQGLLVLYETRRTKRGEVTIEIGGVVFAADDPQHIIWRSDEPLYTSVMRERDDPRLLGAIIYERDIIVYGSSLKDKLFTFTLANPYAGRGKRAARGQLHRFARNPILAPSYFEWESEAVFNPAAFVDNGRVHLLYRAMGPDGISRIGHASSTDGVNFDERSEEPVYTPSHGFGLPGATQSRANHKYDPILHPSGGGWAGCEDPRAVVIDGRVYMSFMAFNGWSFMRQALTSMAVEDLDKRKWKWRKPVLISPPGQTHKNWIIFPEKINGKYAILHGLSPKIHIDYIDSLDDFDGETYLSSLPPAGGAGYHDPSRRNHWDVRVRGAGAPPIKTDLGWLLLYHANDRYDPGKYKLGAMLLDLNDPTKVLYRSAEPILEPKEWYENDGKPGVVYTCGAVIVNENLIVYYGGGDKHIAVARAGVQEFLQALTSGHAVSLTPTAGVI